MSAPRDDRPPDPRAPAYARAGVDLDRDEGFIERIKESLSAIFAHFGISSLNSTPGRHVEMASKSVRRREPIVWHC